MVLNVRLPQPVIDFNDPSTRVRINPETYMKFEDGEMVTLHNLAADTSAVRIKYDIMLILYPMVHWTTVGELIKEWPEDDQALIISHLDMLHKAHIVITHESEQAVSTEGNVPKNIGNTVIINVENHHHMLRDTMRMRAYEGAITKAIKPGETVAMDLGTGTGILSFFAARAGAKKVIAIEKRSDVAMTARELIKANGFEDVIELIENSSEMIKAEDLPVKPDVFISEILGNAILEESILEYTIDARDRLLAPNAVLIPYGLDIMAIPYDSGKVINREQEVDELQAIYGFNLELMKTILAQKPKLQIAKFIPENHTIHSEPIKAINLNFYEITSPHFETSFEFTPKEDGYVDGYCLYFRAHMDEHTVLTNSPWAPPTHWTHVVYTFPKRRPVKAGETVNVNMSYDGSFALWYPDEWV